MQLPLEIVFHEIPRSDPLEQRIREKVEHLEKVYPRIMRCRVMVEQSNKHPSKGRLYHVTIDITIPGGEVVVSRDPQDEHAHEDPYVAVRDAFRSARRQLKEVREQEIGRTKHHEHLPVARVVRIFPERGYGFLKVGDGEDVYFQREAVVSGSFDRLKVGSEVRVVVKSGESERGPQASTVR